MAEYPITFPMTEFTNYGIIYETSITLASNEYITYIFGESDLGFDVKTLRAFASGFKQTINFRNSAGTQSTEALLVVNATGSVPSGSGFTFFEYSGWAKKVGDNNNPCLLGQKISISHEIEDLATHNNCTNQDITCTPTQVANAIFRIQTAILKRNVTIATVQGGTASASASNQVNVGSTVTLTATPNTGYQFSSWSSSPSVTITNNQFTMPASDITITPVFTKKSYTLTINQATGGSAIANKSSPVTYGDTVTLTATANEGYQFSSWSSSPTVTITNNQFTMPSQAVTITPNFTKKSYALTINQVTGGTASSNKSSPVQYGTTVTLTATASDGYQFSSWSSSPTVTITNNQFVMPSSAVIITPIFAKKSYALTINQATGGNVTANKSSPITYGDTVTLTAIANEGYQFSSWSSSPSITITNNQFTMPSSAVTITPSFTKKSYTATVIESTNGSASINKTNPIQYSTTVTLTATPNSGFEFLEWQTNPYVAINSSNQFSMPAFNFTIIPLFKKASSTVNAGRYDGSAYQKVIPYYYNGTNWVACEWKRYNGSSWDDVDTT